MFLEIIWIGLSIASGLSAVVGMLFLVASITDLDGDRIPHTWRAIAFFGLCLFFMVLMSTLPPP